MSMITLICWNIYSHETQVSQVQLQFFVVYFQIRIIFLHNLKQIYLKMSQY